METTPLVGELLPEAKDEAWKERLFSLFGMETLLDKHIVLLSSGELRKFQLVKSLMNRPDVLILDNPFIGLDSSARSLLTDLLTTLIANTHLQVMLMLSREEEIPGFITHVVHVEGLVCGEKQAAFCHSDDRREEESRKHKVDAPEILRYALDDNVGKDDNHGEDENAPEIIRLNKVSIRYGERIILDGLDWVVRKGEKWALTGENGSGKSTLLSLICADNPQSYACDIALFGRKRGTGESIWEIKKHIGYVSPEMHRAYLKNLPAIEAQANAFIWSDTHIDIRFLEGEALQQAEYRAKKFIPGQVRLVAFPGADCCACCGTHVLRSGQVGLIKLLSCQKFREGVRMELLCGKRAFDYLSGTWEQNLAVSRALSAKPLQTAAAVERLQGELESVKLRAATLETADFARKAEAHAGEGDIVLFEGPMSADSVRRLCDAVLETCGGRCAVFAGEDGSFKYAVGIREGDIRPLVKELNAALNGRGGGKPNFAQGSVAASEADIKVFFEKN